MPAVPADALIATNGVCERIAPKGTFPNNENIFRLVSIARNGKSVEIGIVGGSFDSGRPTATLKLGEKLTLVNTADGTRYEIALKASCTVVTPSGELDLAAFGSDDSRCAARFASGYHPGTTTTTTTPDRHGLARHDDTNPSGRSRWPRTPTPRSTPTASS